MLLFITLDKGVRKNKVLDVITKEAGLVELDIIHSRGYRTLICDVKNFGIFDGSVGWLTESVADALRKYQIGCLYVEDSISFYVGTRYLGVMSDVITQVMNMTNLKYMVVKSHSKNGVYYIKVTTQITKLNKLNIVREAMSKLLSLGDIFSVELR